MRVAVLIPTRGDRPELLENCLRQLKAQTLQPYTTCIINETPKSEACDITYRYRVGYELLSKDPNIDVIAFIEDDDYYAPTYLEYMAAKWEQYGRPDILGCNYTIYYHVKLKKYFTFNHEARASAMNTLIKPGLNFSWCPDSEPYTDIHLWQTVKGVIFHPERHVCIGMKHGIGKTGGRMHVDRLQRYSNDDNGFLKSNLDEASFNFYNNLQNG